MKETPFVLKSDYQPTGDQPEVISPRRSAHFATAFARASARRHYSA